MSKPRITYAQFQAQQMKYPKGSYADLIERFIREMESVRPVGESHGYQLRRHQREPIGAKVAAEFTEDDFIDYCKWRKEQGVCASTVMQDITYMTGVLKYARAAWKDCKGIKPSVITDVKPFLLKNGYIGKSTPRDRRPQEQEIAEIIAYFSRPYAGYGFEKSINMPRMIRWQLASGRRVGESCALLWQDWNRDNHTILVRKMKDPKNKNKQKVVALPDEAQAMLEELWPARGDEPRIFPYRAKSVSAAYTRAKKPGEATPEGIKDLRLHDCRRDCASRLIERGFTAEEAIGFTGHETTQVFQRSYMRARPELLKDGPANMRAAR